MNAPNNPTINGFDPAVVNATTQQLAAQPELAIAEFRVSTTWRGASRVTNTTLPLLVGGQPIARAHIVECDEPVELFGTDEAANPAELLLSALGSCIAITCAANAAMMGIELRSLYVETDGMIDLRGALGVDEATHAGFARVGCQIVVESDASSAQLEELVASISSTSPIVDSVSRAIGLNLKLTRT